MSQPGGVVRLSENFEFTRPRDRGRPVRHAQLSLHACDMGLCGVARDVKLATDIAQRAIALEHDEDLEGVEGNRIEKDSLDRGERAEPLE